MHKILIPLWILVTALCLAPTFSIVADDAKVEEKEEKPKLVPKEKEKKPKTVIEWMEIKNAKGLLKKPEYKKNNAKQAEPMKVEFSSEAASVRIKGTTKAPEGKRGGSMAMTIYKKKESKGDKETYQRLDRLGTVRSGDAGGKMLSLGKGEFYIELEGDAIEYEITIEAAEKKEVTP